MRCARHSTATRKLYQPSKLMASNEQIELSREVDATQIPSGIPHRLSAGTKVRLMQALGGSYTVMTDMGYMVRVDAKDADALGITPTSAAMDGPQEFSEKLVWDKLRTVYDPEMPVNVVVLALIYDFIMSPEAIVTKPKLNYAKRDLLAIDRPLLG